MISFILSIVVLIAGYFIYGRIVEKVFGAEPKRPTPAVANPDGVDYVQMPTWKCFLIQFLNIAGLGPIFGAIMGILYGPSAFLWIVFGTLFGGAVHDYFSGMISLRSNGASLPEVVGAQLGAPVKQFMRGFSLILMILVGAVFVSGPAELLCGLTGNTLNINVWIALIFIYYMLATLLPIDKLIGKIYPVFGFALLFMASGILVAIFANNAPIPEFTDGFKNYQKGNLPVFPMMFVSIACGAISGFHATQSPMIARCIKNERYGRRVFYGSMVAEGVVALIWAAAASSFFGSIEGLQNFISTLAPTANKPAVVVDIISRSWLGTFGGILAIIGVVAAPITSGDTALRSARLIAADFLKINQRKTVKRLLVSLPIFALSFILLNIDFDVLWRYFAWCNQTLAAFTLWAITVYLAKRPPRGAYLLTLIPAVFMTMICTSYILISPEGLTLSPIISYLIAGTLSALTVVLFCIFLCKFRRSART
ncbi:MAG: carbon starvation protein A [Prevotellaceae bacterium]|jgi:carbon starvation protein CstA|nr:carbon starvation protein A [Prevotellaceae bacterium]